MFPQRATYNYEVWARPKEADKLESVVPGVLTYIQVGRRSVRCNRWEGDDTEMAIRVQCPLNAGWILEREAADLGLSCRLRNSPYVPEPWRRGSRDTWAALGDEALSRAVDRGEMSPAQVKRALVYQRAQAGFSATRDATLLVWAPGAGKTFGALCGALVHDGPILICAPGGVRHEWWSQIQKFTLLRPWRQKPASDVKPGDETLPEYLAWCASTDQRPVVILGHEALPDSASIYEQVSPAIVIFDEIHLLGSNKRWEAIEDRDGNVSFRGKRASPGGKEKRAYHAMLLSRHPSVRVRIGLTGTPLGDGRPRRLWAQFDLLCPGDFSHSYRRFAFRYCEAREGDYGLEDKGSSNMRELRARASFFMHEVTHLESHGELPPTRIEVCLVPTEEQCAPGRFSDDLTFGQAIRAAGKRRSPGEIAEIKLAEASSRKRPRVVREALEGVKGGGKVMVFVTRKLEAEVLATAIAKAAGQGDEATGTRVLMIHGDLPESQRQAALDDYTEGPGNVVLVATGHSVGTGKDGMQYTTLALFSGLPWQADQFVQWKGRFDRHGDGERLCSTLVKILIAEHTYDEDIQRRLADKFGSVQAFFESDDLTQIIDRLQCGKDAESLYDSLVSNLFVLEDDE